MNESNLLSRTSELRGGSREQKEWIHQCSDEWVRYLLVSSPAEQLLMAKYYSVCLCVCLCLCVSACKCAVRKLTRKLVQMEEFEEEKRHSRRRKEKLDYEGSKIVIAFAAADWRGWHKVSICWWESMFHSYCAVWASVRVRERGRECVCVCVCVCFSVQFER